MTCPFDRETLADYANEDLPASLRQATEEHLQACQACRLVVEQYQEGAEALAGAVAATSLPAGMSQPLPGRRPVWPVWATTAAAAACLLLLLQIPAVAETARTLYVAFWGQEQVEEAVQAFRSRRVDDGPQWVPTTVEEAEHAYNRPVALPTYLPEGYQLQQVLAKGDSPVQSVTLEYSATGDEQNNLFIIQRPAVGPREVSYLEGEQPVVVDVNGTEAYVTDKVIQMKDDGTYTIQEDYMRRLVFEWNGDIVEIFSYALLYPQTVEPLSTEELVKIAASIQ